VRYLQPAMKLERIAAIAPLAPALPSLLVKVSRSLSFSSPGYVVSPLDGASGRKRVLITRMEADRTSKIRHQFWVDIERDPNEPPERLKIEQENPNHPEWVGLCSADWEVDSKASPIAADIYTDTQGEPVMLVIRGALARIISAAGTS
jgi:hypothetical protein